MLKSVLVFLVYRQIYKNCENEILIDILEIAATPVDARGSVFEECKNSLNRYYMKLLLKGEINQFSIY